jgi:hypothetical protein
MVSQLEFCPKCQGSCSTSLSIGLKRTIHQDGSEGQDILFHLHCRSCNTYIRSYPMATEGEEPEMIKLPQNAFLVDRQRIPA